MKRKFNFILIIYTLVCLLPLTAGIIYAIAHSIGAVGLLNSELTLKYWTAIVKDNEAWSSIIFSFYVALISIFLSVLIALLLTIVFRKYSSVKKVSLLLYLPLSLPAIVMSFYMFEMLSNTGLISRITFYSGGLNSPSDFPDLINDNFGIGIIITHISMAFPFLTLIFLNLYNSENIASLENLALSLGARKSFISKRITIPILLQKGFPTIVLYGIFVLGSYEIPLLLGSQSISMVSPLIIKKLQKFNLFEIPEGYVLSILFTFFTILVTVFIYHVKRRNYT